MNVKYLYVRCLAHKYKSPSWITNDPSGITVKSDFRVAFFIQPPSQPLLAGVVRHLLISLPNLKYGAKQRIAARTANLLRG